MIKIKLTSQGDTYCQFSKELKWVFVVFVEMSVCQEVSHTFFVYLYMFIYIHIFILPNTHEVSEHQFHVESAKHPS